MKKGILSIILIFAFWHGFSQDQPFLKVYGDITTDQRIMLNDKSEWAWNENRVSLKLEKKIENGKFYSEIWIRNFGIPTYGKVDNLFNRGIIDPFDIQVREAYFQISDLFVKNLDLKIGRQRIAWGTADKLNPTDNLNPHDLEDILDFGRHRGSDAINLTYYFKNGFSIQGVLIPFSQPANLPVGIFGDALMPSYDRSFDTTINYPLSSTINIPIPMRVNIATHVIRNPLNFAESNTWGLKFKGTVKSIDFSLSYVYGYDGIPCLTKTSNYTNMDMINVANSYTNIDAELSFTRNHIFGIDFSSNIKGVGVWGEAALFKLGDDLLLNSTTTLIKRYHIAQMPWLGETNDTTATDTSMLVLDRKKPYIKFILGADYHFGKGSYVNLQFMHGFIHERGKLELNDYLFVRYDQRLFNDKVTLSPLSGAFVVTDWKNLKNNFAIIYMPQVAYYPIPEVELNLSYVWMKGKGEGLFASFSNFNMLVLKAKFSF